MRHFSAFNQSNESRYVRRSLGSDTKWFLFFSLDRFECVALFIVRPISIWLVYDDLSTVLKAIRRPQHLRCISIWFRNQKSVERRALNWMNSIRDWMMPIRNSRKQRRRRQPRTKIHCVLFVIHIGYKENFVRVNIKLVCKWSTCAEMIACYAFVSA